MKKDSVRGSLLVLMAALAWSTAGLFTHALAVDVWTILFWRSVFGAFIVSGYLICVRREPLVSTIIGMERSAWFVAGISAAGMVVFIPALRLTAVANVALIYASMPLLAAFIGWIFFGDKITGRILLACTGVVLGATVIVSSSLSAGVGFAGNILALLMTLAMAIMALAFRRNAALPAVVMVVVSNVFAAGVALPFANPFSVNPQQFGLLALFGLVQMALGLVFFSLGSKLLPASTTALIGAVEAPIAPLWVWLTYGEVPALPTFVGGTFILAAVLSHLLFDLRSEGRLRFIGGSPKLQPATKGAPL
jgi:drug/metabolite transporter (DMT)-like permease